MDDADVLVLGASYSALELVHRLRALGSTLRVTLVDRASRHPYLPLVQEILCGRLDEPTWIETAEVVSRMPHTRFVQGEIVAFQPRTKAVTLADGRRLGARFVVVALGSELAPPGGIEQGARFLRYKLPEEVASAQERLTRRLVAGRASLVVVGGGISGIELAGDLGRLARRRPLGTHAPEVTLIHGGDELIPTQPERARRLAARHLQEQGVELVLGARVVRYEPGAVVVQRDGREERVLCDEAFWSAGLRAPAILGALGLKTTAGGWLHCNPQLQSTGHTDVFVIGDAARVVENGAVWPTMQRAIECLFSAWTVAPSLVRLAKERRLYPRGVPELRRHPLWRDFTYGLSLGEQSLFVLRPLVLDLGPVNIWFRRFLMRRYFERYG